MTKAKLVPVPQVAAAQVAGEQLAGVGQAVVKAATTPIYARKRREVWDPEAEEWVPVDREREIQVTPAAIGVAVIGGALLAAIGQRGIRTGTLGRAEVPRKVYAPNPAHAEWAQRVEREDALDREMAAQGLTWDNPAGRKAAREANIGPEPKKKVWMDDPSGAKKRVWTVRTRDSIADYQPAIKGV